MTDEQHESMHKIEEIDSEQASKSHASFETQKVNPMYEFSEDGHA